MLMGPTGPALAEGKVDKLSVFASTLGRHRILPGINGKLQANGNVRGLLAMPFTAGSQIGYCSVVCHPTVLIALEELTIPYS